MQWETVIGLEIHCQLNTQTKIFSGAATAYGAEPNTQACEVSLALPGVLPVLNKEVVKKAVMFGLAIHADIAEHSVFERKNYFYPDLPKAYQISQLEKPIVEHGQLDIMLDDGTPKTIGITRAHLEEDAGKSLHDDFDGMTGIDLNRAGTPLIEIVSEPDLRSAKEAVAYMRKIHAIVQYLDISDGNMQEGSFRCDANVSVRPKGETKLGTRTELKNINSFRFVERAINYEVERQIEVLESGGRVVQETRLYDADDDSTRSMRSKEEANDYRYFPDPDLLPVVLDASLLAELQANMPELPEQKQQRFLEAYGLSVDDAQQLTATRAMAEFFEQVLAQQSLPAKLVANWVLGEFSAALNQNAIEVADSPVNAERLATLLLRISDNTLSSKSAKQVFQALWNGTQSVDQIIAEQGLEQMSDTGELETIIQQVVAANPQQVAQYRAGKDKVFGFFVGQVMKATKGKANPQQVNQILKQKLS